MFGKKLKELRIKENLSQESLADLIHVSRSTIAKWENGIGYPSDANLDSLAAYFKIEKEELLVKKPINKRSKLIKILVAAISSVAIIAITITSILLIDFYTPRTYSHSTNQSSSGLTISADETLTIKGNKGSTVQEMNIIYGGLFAELLGYEAKISISVNHEGEIHKIRKDEYEFTIQIIELGMNIEGELPKEEKEAIIKSSLSNNELLTEEDINKILNGEQVKIELEEDNYSKNYLKVDNDSMTFTKNN